MIACSCPKCSTYGNASYCINDIIDEGKAEYESSRKKSDFWMKFSLCAAGIFCSIPVVIRILDYFVKS
jgi:hypothetical protein